MSETTRSILVSGVWNVLAKLALPVVALVLLAAPTKRRRSWSRSAALGVAILAAVDRAVLAGPAQRRLRRRRSAGWPTGCLSFLTRLDPAPTGRRACEEAPGVVPPREPQPHRGALGAADRLDRDLQRAPSACLLLLCLEVLPDGAQPPRLGGGVRRLHGRAAALERLGHPERPRLRRGRHRRVAGGRRRRPGHGDRRRSCCSRPSPTWPRSRSGPSAGWCGRPGPAGGAPVGSRRRVATA